MEIKMTLSNSAHYDNSGVGMTTNTLFFDVITKIAEKLPLDLEDEHRYNHLLECMQSIFPFDAAAVLKLDGSLLKPLAIRGLSHDVLGRRFVVSEHPRFMKALNSREPIHFESNSILPDPYDGLIEDEKFNTDIHDCMGIALFIDNKPWGLLTLDAINPGAFDHINPLELKTFTRLTESAVKAAERIETLETSAAHHQLVSQALSSESPGRIIGSSPAIQKLKEEISIVAQSHLSVLVLGETGVGKELVARRVHSLSPRSSGPLIYINCAALPENIAESELFGHIKGSFSGAVSDRAGKFEVADGGTLFLDEVGELPLSIQPKLLRALQSGEIQRVGSDKLIKVNVRIVAATNRVLQEEVAQNRFRADLFHRLSVYPINVPPLRDRDKDILLLSGYLLEVNQKRLGVEGLRITPEAKHLLMTYSWPGNIRELEHTLSRASLKAIAEQGRTKRSIVIDYYHLDIKLNSDHAIAEEESYILQQKNLGQLNVQVNGNLKNATEEFQRQFIEKILSKHNGNQAAAAREMGINRSNFYRLLKRLEGV
jgi:anaerobic nitric oxide reductase transcription regulator